MIDGRLRITDSNACNSIDIQISNYPATKDRNRQRTSFRQASHQSRDRSLSILYREESRIIEHEDHPGISILILNKSVRVERERERNRTSSRFA